MYVVTFGYVKVPTAGTPVPLSAVLAAAGLAADLRVAELRFNPLLANAGTAYVGLDTTAPRSTGAAMNKGTGANVIRQVAKPSATAKQEDLAIVMDDQANGVRVADYSIDADTNNDGFTIFGLVA